MSAKPPIFTRDFRALVPQEGATLSVSAFGLDVLQRPFLTLAEGAESRVPSKGTADIVHTQLRATGAYSKTVREGLMCLVTVEYKGLIRGALPDALISTSMTTGSATATAGDSDIIRATQRTWDILFYAPSITFRYITTSRVTAPKYGISGGLQPHIFYQTIRDGNGRRRTSATNIIKQTREELRVLNSTPVPGTPYFENEETWARIITLEPKV